MQKYDVIVVGAGNPSPPAKVEMLLILTTNKKV